MNNPLTDEEKESLIKFTDKFTTCTLNPYKVKEHIEINASVEEGREIIQIVRDCQLHHHTKTCTKKGGKCRFSYPKLPFWKTVLSQRVTGESSEEIEELQLKYEKIIKAVEEVIQTEEVIDNILANYDLEA